MKDLKGKVVLVAGGSSGIGAAAARAFARQGARTVVQYNASEAAAAALVAEIGREGGEAQMIGGDVTDLANVSRCSMPDSAARANWQPPTCSPVPLPGKQGAPADSRAGS